MSNLGPYQTMTTWSKRVGGPYNLAAIIAFGGYGLGKLGELGVKSLKKLKHKRKEPKVIYTIISQGISNEGLTLDVDDKFRVLESDKDVILIEKIGDPNNPYFVSADLLRSISDYN